MQNSRADIADYIKEEIKMCDKKKRISRCRFSLPHYKDGSTEYHCVADGWEDDKVRICTEEECEQCMRFDSKYIEYPIFVNEIENKPIRSVHSGHEIGSLVAVRPCGEEYKDKTYLGIYLGELPIQILTSYDPHNGVLTNSTMDNPGIFVPELKKIVYGCESWWNEIESEEDLKDITDEDIENTWYVKIYRWMHSKS